MACGPRFSKRPTCWSSFSNTQVQFQVPRNQRGKVAVIGCSGFPCQTGFFPMLNTIHTHNNLFQKETLDPWHKWWVVYVYRCMKWQQTPVLNKSLQLTSHSQTEPRCKDQACCLQACAGTCVLRNVCKSHLQLLSVDVLNGSLTGVLSGRHTVVFWFGFSD